jgi:hypothetical protein
MQAGDKVKVDGYADELGIKDYGTVRVVSYGIIADTPRKYSKKVLVTLDSIDGEGNVTVLCFRNKITLL